MTETAVTPPITPTPSAPQAQSAPVYENYWGSDETVRHFLPDKVQWFDIKVMNEGAKSQYQKMTNSDLEITRDNSAKVRTNPARDRHELIKASVIGWNLMQQDKEGGWSAAPFHTRTLEKWLEVAPPKIVEELEFAIRMANPWMQSEMTVDEIDKEIERLQLVRQQVVEREAGETSSANK